jgi:hypothetical protein
LIRVLLEYVAIFLFLSGLVLVGGGLAFLTCNAVFGRGLFFVVMLTIGVVFTLSGKCLGYVVGGEDI